MNEKPEFGIADALGHFRSIIDNTHRFLTYFQVVSAATVAALLSSGQDVEFITLAVIISLYSAFCLVNGTLAYRSQTEAFTAWTLINAASSEVSVRPEALRDVMRLRQPAKPGWIICAYITISGSVSAAIILSHCLS